MNAKISVFVICVEAIICFVLHNFYDCTFNKIIKLINWYDMYLTFQRIFPSNQVSMNS